MKWLFYVIVFVYMLYRTVYGAKPVENDLVVDPQAHDEFLKVGSHKSISCKSTNRNQRVEWIDPNGKTIKRVPGGRIFSQEHFVQAFRGRVPALVLTITSAKVQDTGVYTCKAGDLTKNVSLCVIEPSDFVDTPSEVEADIGRSITLSCQAKGDPEPRISWNRTGVTISDDDNSGKYRVMTKFNTQGYEGLLTITSLEPEDSGIYTCQSIQESPDVEDCSHTSSYNITLNVNYPPIFEEGNKTKLVYGTNNKEVDIVCAASGYPQPAYRFFKELSDDVSFEYNLKQIKLIEDGSKAVLTVVANQSTFNQRFKCLATNENGGAVMYFALIKTAKPKRPSEVSFVNATSDTINLNVTWYDEVEFPINAFEVQFLKDQSKRIPKEAAWKRSGKAEINFEDVEIIDPEVNGLVLSLDELEEDTVYWIRLRVANEVGESLWSTPVRASTNVKEVTEETPEAESEESGEGEEEGETSMNDATFYGIFFAGGIFVVVFVCMFAMKLVK